MLAANLGENTMRKSSQPFTLMGRAENLNPRTIAGNETGRGGYRRPGVIVSTSGRGNSHPIVGFLLGLGAVALIAAMFWPVLS